jgi:hypothetical protein
LPVLLLDRLSKKEFLPSFLWIILMMVLGWTGALYTFIALQTSGGDWHRFWYGKRANRAEIR